MRWIISAVLVGTALLLAAGAGSSGRRASAQAGPSIKIIAPTAGQKITDADLKVSTSVSNFKVQCANVGLPDKAGEGHIHAMIDGMTMAVLTNFYCDPNFTISGDGLKPGKHQLIVVLAGNTHDDVGEPTTVDIDYQPAQARPLPAAVQNPGKPSIKTSAPADKATVAPKFNLNVQAANFKASCTLEGKGNVVGYGHYHVFVDLDMAGMMQGGMMSMAGMIAMPCENTIPVDLSAWANGTHTITVELVNNDHTSIADAEPAMIAVNLQGSPGTGRAASPAAVGALPAAGTGGLSAAYVRSHSTGAIAIAVLGVLFAVMGGGALLVRRLRA